MNENDAAFVVDAEVDNQFRARHIGASSRSPRAPDRSPKSNTNSTGDFNDNENEPLLSDSGSVGSRSSEDRPSSAGSEWFGIAELAGLPWWKRPSIFWLLPPFLLFTMAFGGIIVPKLNLVMDLICRDYYEQMDIPGTSPISVLQGEQDDRCRSDSVSSRVSLFVLYGNLASGILSAITAPKLGALSDRYGRKKLLVFTTAGTLFGEVITILTAKHPESISTNWILLGYAMDGLCGSFVVGMALAHSYATDCTHPSKRNVAFGYFHACLFTGIAAGPILAGYIIEKTKTVLSVFYIALVCHVIFIGFLLFCIPESLSKSRQHAAREKHRAEMERLGPAPDWVTHLRSINLFRPLKILYPTGRGTSRALRRNLVLLAFVDTIIFSVAMGAMGVIVIYTRTQFGWQNWESSKFVSIINTCRVLCLMVALPLITRFIRGRDSATRQRNSGSDLFDLSVIRVAILFDMLGYLGYTVARSGTIFTLSGSIASIGGMGSPTLGSVLTKHVPPDRTGQLLGATGLLHALARIIGPTIFNGIFSATVGKYRQTVFACLTATFGLAFIVSWFVRPHVYLEDIDDDDEATSLRREIPEEEAMIR